MFITKKKLEEMIANEREKTAREIDERRYVDNMMEEMHRRLFDLDRRVNMLQNFVERATGKEMLTGEPRAAR